MAYDDDGYGNSYEEAPIFSSPLIQYAGTVAGDAEDGDNARCIRETMGVVAAYRTQAADTFTVTATAGTGGSVTPASRTVAAGATASFTVTANSGYTKNPAVGGTAPKGSWNGDVYTSGSVTSNCTVSFSFTQMVDDHGNDCTSATEVALFTGTANVSVNGSLESEGDYDYFMIQVPSSGTLKVYTTGNTDTYGYLKASNCSGISENDDSGDNNFMISESLNAGTYYVAVKGCSGTETGDYVLGIEFTETIVRYPLSLSMTGTGAGKITGTPGSLDCSSTCSYEFDEGTTVTLTATASSGSTFKGWTGAYTGTQNPVKVTMNSAKGITARFDRNLIYKILDSGIQANYLTGISGLKSVYTDFGGTDVYAVLSGMSGDVEIRDNQNSMVYLPAGLTVSAASFLSNGARFTINGFTLTLLGKPELFTYVFAGTPLNPSAGIPRTYEQTAQAFGTTVPASGQPANAATVTGTVQSDGSIK